MISELVSKKYLHSGKLQWGTDEYFIGFATLDLIYVYHEQYGIKLPVTIIDGTVETDGTYSFVQTVIDRAREIAGIANKIQLDVTIKNIEERAESERVNILYTNYKNNTAKRTIKPVSLYLGKTEYHPDNQWLLHAWDYDKQDFRTFAMKNIQAWKPRNVLSQ